jgi:hypothetical protein
MKSNEILAKLKAIETMNPQEAMVELRSTPIVGNAYHDQALFNLADRVILGDAPMADKIEALQKVHDATDGDDGQKMTEEDVEEHILLDKDPFFYSRKS